ncbi:MAG: glutamyl-tRNA synthetase [Phycisphaerales bacterium]|jgi:glutamyl-tRNA synthetase
MVPAGQENTPLAEVTRLAPSPTGALHLGNARTFIFNWAMARQRGWRVGLRIEDLDATRVKPGAIEQTIEILEWLGLDWDEGPVVQSHDPGRYVDAMQRLARAGAVYPCELTRTEIEQAASAPQEGVHETVFPAHLRPAGLGPTEFTDTGSNWRFAVPDEPIEFDDAMFGRVRVSLPETIGDFVVWSKRGQPSYQLAVVVDDAQLGVTQVVRGNDLLDSTARQLVLYRALGLGAEPSHTHLPLVRGPDGRRLAKRHGDSRLTTWMARGMAPERVIGLIAWWASMTATPEPMSTETFLEHFNPCTIPMTDTVYDRSAEAWLTS